MTSESHVWVSSKCLLPIRFYGHSKPTNKPLSIWSSVSKHPRMKWKVCTAVIRVCVSLKGYSRWLRIICKVRKSDADLRRLRTRHRVCVKKRESGNVRWEGKLYIQWKREVTHLNWTAIIKGWFMEVRGHGPEGVEGDIKGVRRERRCHAIISLHIRLFTDKLKKNLLIVS